MITDNLQRLVNECIMLEDGNYLGGNFSVNLKDCQNELDEIKQKLNIHSVMQGLPTFEQILREEFLVNTENYPKEYHKLFNDKFNRAKRRHDELSSSPTVASEGEGEANTSAWCNCIIPNPDMTNQCFKCGKEVDFKRG